MKRKLIIGLSLFALAVAVIGSGVLYAYFSDTINVDDNTFTAGELLLQVGDPTVEKITVDHIAPGDSDIVAEWNLQNMGNIAANLDIAISPITNLDNTANRAEIAAGDNSSSLGELGQYLKFAFWMDVNNDGAWSTGDYYLSSTGPVSYSSGAELPAAAFAILDNYDSRSFANLQTNIPQGAIGHFHIEYVLPPETGNIVQTDSSAFDLSFTLNQYHA